MFDFVVAMTNDARFHFSASDARHLKDVACDIPRRKPWPLSQWDRHGST